VPFREPRVRREFYKFFYGVYNTLIVLLFPLVIAIVFLRWRKRVLRKGLDRWQERWGLLSEAQLALFAMGHRWWWVHAVSLGEVKAIERFLRQAPSHAGVRVLLSVVTPEALAYARDAQVADQIIAAPIDLSWVVRRVFRSVRPEWFLSVESEFWPNLLREAARSGARVGLINGRISQRSFRRYRWIKFILGALWENLHLIAVREEQDAQRFQALGLHPSRIRVVGHMKYDVPVESLPFSAPHDVPLVVLGSTREGEEALVLPTLRTLRVICAPRHVERVGEVEDFCVSAGIRVRRRSQAPEWLPGAGEVLLWDTFGDLLQAYRKADIAVIGGSFVNKGGQNPIEPAALGRPVVFGPSMENFKEISEALLAGGGAIQISLDTLAATIVELVHDRTRLENVGTNARSVVEKAGGATERTLQILERPL
jgi:3-deoxy-D-manno-octulosonic-acid transferase